MTQKTEYQDIRPNRAHKADVFAMAFKNKKDLLDLYNVVSFMIRCTMNLYEHQSSYNPNMPLRGLLYFSKLFNKYTKQRKLNLYSRGTAVYLQRPAFLPQQADCTGQIYGCR
jgi:hypothetical protein